MAAANVNAGDISSSLEETVAARLSGEAYSLAHECSRLAAVAAGCEALLKSGERDDIARELMFAHSRMTLLGGFFAGMIPVQNELDLEGERSYMTSLTALLGELSNMMEPC
ncbi:hypothetical protein [Stutzerimonas stutzeri]|uniref:hypothetical protein n=1 Tax=Stutzerimonas stutzeri TaxID=316 RepID=UPI0015E3523A|nr:hypothetical protein [Stutzerimonas stutzeri]MBA1280411.1 hypothetical protein [Stutzerimonas stutzeri]